MADCKPTDAAVHDVCHAAKGVHPDFIVLDSPLVAPARAIWRHASPDGSEPADHFLYECRSFP
jgi:hypothetical protein